MNRPLAAALLLGAALVSFNLGAAPLLEPDEGRYADIARAFADHGDWTVPRLDGVTFHDKPPLVPWLVALAFRALGRGEGVARLVSAVAGVAGLGAAALLASATRRAAWLAALILLASPLWLALSKFLSLDVAFAALVAWSWALLLRGRGARLVGGALLGLAVLTKGPAALALTGAAALALAAWERRPADASRLVLPFAVALAVAAPWYGAFALRDPEGARAFLLEENVARFLAWREHKHGPHFYLVTALWAHAPLAWLLALAAAGTRARGGGLRALVAFVVVTYAIFTVASSKVEAYVLPAAPVLAALLARRIDGALATSSGRARLARVCAAASGILALAPLGWLAFARLGAEARDRRLAAIAATAPRSAALALFALPLAAAAIVAARRGRATASVACALAASSVTLLGAQPVLETIARSRSAAPVAAVCSARPGARVVCFTTYTRGLPYYLGEPVALALSSAELSRGALERERPDLWLPDEERVLALFRAGRPLVVVVPPRAEDAFKALAARAGATPANGRLVALGTAAELVIYELRP